jgi:hypothetical protein
VIVIAAAQLFSKLYAINTSSMKNIVYLSVILGLMITQNFYVHQFRDEERRKAVTQAILDNLISEKYEDVRKDFHVTLKQILPVEKISETWRQIISVNGPFKKVIAVSTATDKGFNQIRMRCQFENDNSTVEVTFNEEDKVIGLIIKP